jgi:hypothetical protein
MFSSPEGAIRSPYYPGNYPKNRECVYLISQPPGKGILLDFLDFDIESGDDTRCIFDYLEVYMPLNSLRFKCKITQRDFRFFCFGQIRDGDNSNASLIGHYCGPPASAPERVISTFNYLWIKFKTDGSIQNRGFYANFSTIDTG